MATEVALNLPQFYEDDYNPYKMRVLVEEIERLHAALTQDVDDEGVSGTVDSFNGRAGDVVPLQADYDSFFLTQAEADALYLTDAPSDGTTYGRNNGAWAAVTSAPQWGAFNYVFDTNTSMADPGPGFVRFNNGTYASATLLAIDDVDDDGNNIESDWLADVTDSTVIRIRDKADHTKWVEFWVNGSNDFVGWRRFDIALKGQSAVAFSNSDAVEVIIDKSQQMEQGDTASSMHDFLYFDGNRWSPSGANLRVNPDALAGAASQRILAQGVSSSDTTRAVIGLNTGNSVSGLWHVTGATNENFYAQHIANADQFVWGFDNNTTETDIFGMQVDSSLRVYSGGTFFLQERAAARTAIAGYGEVWVRNDAPNTLMFTDDTGVDHDLTASGASQLSDLTDVNTSTPTNQNFLVADGVDWESRAINSDDLTDVASIAMLDENETVTASLWDFNQIRMQDNQQAFFGNDNDGQIFFESVSGDFVIDSNVTGQRFEFRENNLLRVAIDHTTDELQLGAYDLSLDDNSQILLGTDDDWALDFNGSNMIAAGATGQSLVVSINASNKFVAGQEVRILNGATIFMDEVADAQSDTAARGQWWVHDETPNVPMFTDDAGNDFNLDGRSEINTQNANYTLVMGDKGKTIYKASGGAGETITIPANATVAFPIGTLIGIDNDGGGDLSIAITTDVLVGTDGTTGTKTLGDNHSAVIQKITATRWRYAASDL